MSLRESCSWCDYKRPPDPLRARLCCIFFVALIVAIRIFDCDQRAMPNGQKLLAAARSFGAVKTKKEAQVQPVKPRQHLIEFEPNRFDVDNLVLRKQADGQDHRLAHRLTNLDSFAI